MLNKKIYSKTLSVFIVFELTFAPVVFAESGPAYTILNEAMGLGNAFIQQQQQQQQNALIQAQMQQFEESVRPVSMPDQFFPECSVLQAKTNVIGNDFRCEGTPDPAKKLMYKKIGELSEEIANDYDNFMVKPHKDNVYGVSCYQKSGKTLDNAIKAEIQKINEQIAGMKAQHEAFLLKTNPLVEDVKLKDAILNGGANANKYLKDAKFDKLMNDPSCNTMYEGASFQDMGKEGGLNKIKTSIIGKGKGVDGGTSTISASSLIQRQGQIEAEIRKMANTVIENTKTGSLFELKAENLLPTTSADSIHTSPLLNKAITDQLNETQNKLKILQRDVRQMNGLDQSQTTLLQMSFNEDFNLEQEIENYSSTFYEQCVNRNISKSFDSVDKFMSKVYDPTISEKANEQADNLFESEFKNIMEQPFTKDETLAKKLEKIQKLESSGANSSKTIVLGKSTSLGDTKFTASQRYRPSDFAKLWFKNCQDSFTTRSVHSKVPPSEVIKKMKTTNFQVKQLAESFPGKVQTNILNTMLYCTQNPSLGSANLSCSDSSVLSPQSPNFCLSGSVKCANNMKACEAKVTKVIDDTRKEQHQKAAAHRQMVEGYKRLTQGYASVYKQSVESFMKVQARYFNAEPFKAGEFNIKLAKDQSTALTGVDESLNMEDPNVYFEVAVKNMETLKTQLEDHAKKVAKEIDARQKVLADNFNKMVDEWKGLKQRCNGFYDSVVAQEQQNYATAEEKRTEEQNKINNFCLKAEAYNQAPGCGEVLEDLADESAEVMTYLTQDSSALGQVNKYKTMCSNFSNEESNPFLDNSSETNQKTLEQMCKEKESQIPDCAKRKLLVERRNKCEMIESDLSEIVNKYCISIAGALLEKSKAKTENDAKDAEKCSANPVQESNVSSLPEYKDKVKDCGGFTSVEDIDDKIAEYDTNLQTLLTQYNQALVVKDMGQIGFNMCNSQNWQQFGKTNDPSNTGGLMFSSGTYGQQE